MTRARISSGGGRDPPDLAMHVVELGVWCPIGCYAPMAPRAWRIDVMTASNVLGALGASSSRSTAP